MTRIYLGLAIAVVLVTTHGYAWQSGKQDCEEDQAKAVAEQASTDADSAVEIVKSDVKREIRYVEKLKLVQASSDECLNRDLPAGIIDILGGLPDHRGAAKSGTPETLPPAGPARPPLSPPR